MAVTKPKKSNAKAAPQKVADFTILPLALPTLPGLPEQCQNAKHYLYVKPRKLNIPTDDDDRCLVVANVPIDASEANLRALFLEQLGGCMVERVEFDSPIPAQPLRKRWKSDNTRPDSQADGEAEKRGKKRKRHATEDEITLVEGVVEDEESALPSLWKTELERSGSGAVVFFVDKQSAKGAMHCIKKTVHENKSIFWKPSGEGVGLDRTSQYFPLRFPNHADANTNIGYQSHQSLIYPPHSVLQSSINAYLTQFTAFETQRSHSRKAARSVPDEDGFITVTRGGRTGPARLEEAERKKAELEERRKRNGVKDDFYRFQNREKRKERENELRRRFEEDKERVRGMRERRGRIRPES